MVAVLVVLLLSGCASQPTNTLTPGYEGAPGVERFLLCAPNVALSLAPVLQDETEPVGGEIEAYLRSQGREVQRIDLYTGSSRWTHAIARAKEQGAIENAPAIFASKLAEEFDFQAIVMPSILLHTTKTRRSNGTWDGVKRRLRSVNAPNAKLGRGPNSLADRVRGGGFSGEIPVTSLHLMVFTREGERVFEGRGGLDFIHEIDLSDAISRRRVEVVVRKDIFDDRRVLREGIAIAFNPYLPPR